MAGRAENKNNKAKRTENVFIVPYSDAGSRDRASKESLAVKVERVGGQKKNKQTKKRLGKNLFLKYRLAPTALAVRHDDGFQESH